MNAGDYYRGLNARIAGANRIANAWLDLKRLHAVQRGTEDLSQLAYVYAVDHTWHDR
jgi:hypothetical protein